jgi:hypothetical protein
MLLTAVEVCSDGFSITPTRSIAMAKLLSDVLPFLWEEWVVMVSGKGQVLLSRCDAVVFASGIAAIAVAAH